MMYCLDTYALWEIHLGNPRYSKLLNNEFVVTDWTLAEFYKTMLREYNKSTADYWFKKFIQHVRKVEINVLIKAVLFQHENKRKNMSLFDCVGYMYSLDSDLKFVTGDKEFKNRPNVEFIK